MKPIICDAYSIYYNSEGYSVLNLFIRNSSFSKIVVIVDSNTRVHCLPIFLSYIKTSIPLETITIDAGEANKNLETSMKVWGKLSVIGVDRNSLIINLGGGVVTDLGGFVSCAFKRGIPFVNIPTTLLAMVDASVGGKTGIDFRGLKNQIGIFKNAAKVIIDTQYLKTLPQNELLSGLAEMFKHGLIHNKAYWEKLTTLKPISPFTLKDYIHDSIKIKHEIVTKDPLEKGLRRILNFGHTLGHAIESYFLCQPNITSLLHGEAIVIGMILEAYISHKTIHLPINIVTTIAEVLLNIYPKVMFNNSDIEQIIDLLKHDKKNTSHNVNFVLLEAIGRPKMDCNVSSESIVASFRYYNNL